MENVTHFLHKHGREAEGPDRPANPGVVGSARAVTRYVQLVSPATPRQRRLRRQYLPFRRLDIYRVSMRLLRSCRRLDVGLWHCCQPIKVVDDVCCVLSGNHTTPVLIAVVDTPEETTVMRIDGWECRMEAAAATHQRRRQQPAPMLISLLCRHRHLCRRCQKTCRTRPH